MAKTLTVPRVSHQTEVHDYSGPESTQLVPSKRTTDHLKRQQIIHFDASIRAGDHIVLGYDRFQATTFLIVANIRHPEGVKKTWWATLEPVGPPEVTVTGQTFGRRW